MKYVLASNPSKTRRSPLRVFTRFLALIALLAGANAVAQDEASPAEVKQFLDSLNYQRGTVTID